MKSGIAAPMLMAGSVTMGMILYCTLQGLARRLIRLRRGQHVRMQSRILTPRLYGRATVHGEDLLTCATCQSRPRLPATSLASTRSIIKQRHQVAVMAISRLLVWDVPMEAALYDNSTTADEQAAELVMARRLVLPDF